MKASVAKSSTPSAATANTNQPFSRWASFCVSSVSVRGSSNECVECQIHSTPTRAITTTAAYAMAMVSASGLTAVLGRQDE